MVYKTWALLAGRSLLSTWPLLQIVCVSVTLLRGFYLAGVRMSWCKVLLAEAFMQAVLPKTCTVTECVPINQSGEGPFRFCSSSSPVTSWQGCQT